MYVVPSAPMQRAQTTSAYAALHEDSKRLAGLLVRSQHGLEVDALDLERCKAARAQLLLEASMPQCPVSWEACCACVCSLVV